VSWGRIDDSWWEHEKVCAIFERVELGELSLDVAHRAVALWSLAVSFTSMKRSPRLTIPQCAMLLRSTHEEAREAAEVLIAVPTGFEHGLWESVLLRENVSAQARAYAVHDWICFQSKSSKRALAGSRGGVKSGESRRKSKTSPERSKNVLLRSPDPDPDPVPVPVPEDRSISVSDGQGKGAVLHTVAEVIEHCRQRKTRFRISRTRRSKGTQILHALLDEAPLTVAEVDDAIADTHDNADKPNPHYFAKTIASWRAKARGTPTPGTEWERARDEEDAERRPAKRAAPPTEAEIDEEPEDHATDAAEARAAREEFYRLHGRIGATEQTDGVADRDAATAGAAGT
jgi:hypothetical protein